MIKKTTFILSILCLVFNGHGQDNYSGLFYNDLSALNAAYIGTLENYKITTYTWEYDTNFDIDKFSRGRVALNMPFSKIYSAFGIHATYEKYNIHSDLELGFIYSFAYNITSNIKVAIGSNLSIFKKKIKGTMWAYDEDNPFNQYSEKVNETANLYNLDLGFWLKIHDFQVGLSNKHMNNAKQVINILGFEQNYQLYSSLNLILNYDFNFNQKHTLSNSLLIFDLKDFSEGKYFILNNQFAIYNKFIVGLTTHGSKFDKFRAVLAPNIGFNLSGKFDFIMSMDLININHSYSQGNIIEAILNCNF